MSHADELYTDLLTLFPEMLAHYQQLLELSQREREALTAASLPTLLEITTRKETLVLELSMMEEGRQVLLRKLAEHLGVPPAELTLGGLSTLAPEAFADAFQHCRTDLVALLQKLGQVNERNAMLLNSSLAYVQTSLGLLHLLLEPAPMYGSNGHLDTTDTGGKVLQKHV